MRRAAEGLGNVTAGIGGSTGRDSLGRANLQRDLTDTGYLGAFQCADTSI